MLKQKFNIFLLGFYCLFILIACGQPQFQVAEPLAQAIVCDRTQSKWWDSIYENLQNKNFVISEINLSRQIHDLPQDLNSISGIKFKGDLQRLLNKIFLQIPKNLQTDSKDKLLEFLVSLELGSQQSLIHRQEAQEINNLITKLRSSALNLENQFDCSSEQDSQKNPPPQFADNILPWLKSKGPERSYWGSLWSMGVAYQSCAVLKHKVLDKNTGRIQGIKILAEPHPFGGLLRVIEDLGLYMKTQVYLQDQDWQIEPIYYPSCMKKNRGQLIYDFGGRPKSVNNQVYDLYQDAGTGSLALGVDCSGLVTLGAMTAGLKLKQNRENKFTDVYGVGAGMIANPEGNGLSCFSSTKNFALHNIFEVGDLIANKDHVVQVARIGNDPLGFAKASLKKNCQLISTNDFDFDILQSSPSFGGMGIHQVNGRDYFQKEALSMGQELLAWARIQCVKQIENKNPSAQDSSLQVVRHIDTPSCDSDWRMQLAGEECLLQCLQEE